MRWSLLCLAHLPYLQLKSHRNTVRRSGCPCPDRCLTTIVLSQSCPVICELPSRHLQQPGPNFSSPVSKGSAPYIWCLRPSQGECSEPGRSLNITTQRHDTASAIRPDQRRGPVRSQQSPKWTWTWTWEGTPTRPMASRRKTSSWRAPFGISSSASWGSLLLVGSSTSMPRRCGESSPSSQCCASNQQDPG